MTNAVSYTNLDSGLYFDNGKWTGDFKIASAFPDRAAASVAANEFKVRMPPLRSLKATHPRFSDTSGSRIQMKTLPTFGLIPQSELLRFRLQKNAFSCRQPGDRAFHVGSSMDA